MLVGNMEWSEWWVGRTLVEEQTEVDEERINPLLLFSYLQTFPSRHFHKTDKQPVRVPLQVLSKYRKI